MSFSQSKYFLTCVVGFAIRNRTGGKIVLCDRVFCPHPRKNHLQNYSYCAIPMYGTKSDELLFLMGVGYLKADSGLRFR